MKKIILIIFAICHILISLAIFVVGREYANMIESSNAWLINGMISVSFLVAFSLSNPDQIKKISNSLLIVYPIGLVLISFIIFYDLPNFTYKEAKEMVLLETAEEFDQTKENEIKGSLGMYYFYTKENVYIFNAVDGNYAKREHGISK